MSNPSFFIALDFENWNEAEKFLVNNELKGVPVKVGMELFYQEGPSVIEKLKENNHPIFLDLKLHDIPTTVMKAMRNLGKLGVDIVNVHALGGSDMIKAAKEGLLSSNTETKLIAVTILTSMDKHSLNNELLIPGDVLNNAMHFAGLAKQSGADGVVCSVHEAMGIKKQCGNDFLTVTPGIRLENTDVNDQKRVATPSYAKENGADILVIGRSITKAQNPRVAYETALKECGIK
ncbi:orotidine-5'-phosphate decarboxylase [Oceanobacillus sp. Castelsardo]|uniref:orotidine-5'-phosphate decarboxylase n=1 Tax=Oceanobacillus sp. Castelsardo TaxID=1851204 RepID=UPI000839AE61|nr:orotidine-5'-phosphate decarboxylase [Oceanobacillus sp. Castelsardo]